MVSSVSSWFPVLPLVNCPPMWSRCGLEMMLKSPISMMLSEGEMV